jgi:hypothetical protein
LCSWFCNINNTSSTRLYFNRRVENVARLQCLYGIIARPNFISYKERLHNEHINSYRLKNQLIIYSESMPSYEYFRQSSNHSHEEINLPVLILPDKLPLSKLLCVLADGRQLTLQEIDRVLVYLLEKKRKC